MQAQTNDIKYLDVIVDIPHLGDKGSFTYFPEKNKNITDYRLGQAVTVPFGRRNVRGYIVGISSTAEISENKIKRIKKVIGQKPIFSKELLNTLKLLAEYYNSSLLGFINTALPAGVDGSGEGFRTYINYKLNIDKEELEDKIEELKHKAPAQVKVLQILQQESQALLKATELIDRASVSRSVLYSLEDKSLIIKSNEVSHRQPDYELDNTREIIDHRLNTEQNKAVAEVSHALDIDENQNFLLHGVTGSGKTAVYLELIDRTINLNKQAIMLVPEISLTPYMVDFFYARYGDKVAVLHSRLAKGERYDEWQRIYKGEAEIIIGARSAIFAPVQNLGLVIIDEEHENTYKQNNFPYYHARGAAVLRAQQNNSPVLLGSATPSLESYYFAREGLYKYLTLKKRAGQGEMPVMKLIDMREEIKQDNYDILSCDLKKAIESRLNKGEQTLLFLNRRGYASFILCQECGEAIKCSDCDITLTYHRQKNMLKCHYCDFSRQVPPQCPACQSDLLQDFGSGTERLESRIKDEFPSAAVARMDVDTTGGKNSHKKILQKVDAGEIDILIGTQMIAKGHDFHNITLVGVLGTDLLLNLPDFRSSERTYQLLTQVAGRAGRGNKKGYVYIQTYNPGHYALQAVVKSSWKDFYQQELKIRSKLNYPPFSRMVRILFQAETEGILIMAADKVEKFMQAKYSQKFYYLGPTSAPLSRLRGSYRYHLLCFFPSIAARRTYLPEIQRFLQASLDKKINISVDVDPFSML
ncbi:MAG: replication restart helicase PriA [Bacillota bacterium]